MFLESVHNEAKSAFINSFQNEVDSVELKLEKLDLELQKAKTDLDNGIKLLDENSKAHLEMLSKKCDYLKAEIWRYKKLLETYSKAEIGPEMNQRILDLETAIHEHSSLKIEEYKSSSAKQKTKFESEKTAEINNLTQKLELEKDEFSQKINSLFSGFQEYMTSKVNSNKGTTNLEKLISFPVADYSNASSSVRLGNMIHSFKNSINAWDVQIPVIVDFYDKTNFILFYDDTKKSSVENITDGLILRALASNLPDKIQLKIFDSQFWDKFSEFLKLPSSVITKGSSIEEIENSIKTVEKEVREKLTLIWSEIEENNQTTHEFNIKKIKAEKYDDIIPYRLFVVDNCQNLLEQSKLFELLERSYQLTRFGCNFILLFNTSRPMDSEYTEKLKTIQYDTYRTIDLTGQWIPSEFSKDTFITKNLSVEDKKVLLETFQNELNEVVANRAKLRFIDHCEKDKTKWFSGNVGREISIPLGKSTNSDSLEHLKYTTKEFTGALLCGGVGSGKTNLLKSIITSIALKYSPEQMEMYLIDMKNGAGFSVFEAHKLPHVKLYAFSAEIELIDNVFENLRLEMERRYNEYSKFQIDNLEDVYKDERLASSAPKRILVVIDEFGSLGTADDDFLNSIFTNILSIIQKGRGMGINLLFATQNFNNVSHKSFNQAISQFHTRIILKSSPDAAQAILGSSNYNASKEITRIGQGFINYTHGEVNSEGGNHFFKSYLLDNEDLSPLLEEIRAEAERRKLDIAPSLFLDSSIEASFSSNKNLLNKDSIDETQFKKHGISCWIGETFLISNSAHFQFSWKINNKSSDQNILISGNEREYSMQSFISIISSLTYGVPNSNTSIFWIIPFEEELKKDLGLDLLIENTPHSEVFSEGELELVLKTLEDIQSKRSENQLDKTPIIICIPGLERLVTLYKYSGNDELHTIFLNLLRSGSSQGIYFVCEINRASTLAKLGQDVLGAFEHRVAYWMNEDDSREFINSNKACKLIDPENTTCRSKAIYYSQSSQEGFKFKSYINLQTEKALINPKFKPEKNISLRNYQLNVNQTDTTGNENLFGKFNLDNLSDDATISLDLLSGEDN